MSPFASIPLLWVTLGTGAASGFVAALVVLAFGKGGIPDTWMEALAAAPGLVAALAAVVAIDQVLTHASKHVDTLQGEDEVATYEQLRGMAPVLTSSATFTYLLTTLVSKGGWQTWLAVGVLGYVVVLAVALALGTRSLAKRRAQVAGPDTAV